MVEPTNCKFGLLSNISLPPYCTNQEVHQVLYVTQVKLCIEQIEAYQRLLFSLASGMTGRLTLSGCGFNAIEFDPQNYEYIHLESPKS